MSTTTHTYGTWLAAQMKEKSISQRALARLWVEQHDGPNDFETARKAVRRYLTNMTPIERNRHSLARALGSKETGPAEVDKEGD